MKTHTFLSAVATLMLAGCVYDSPLTQEHNIPIDPAALGLWEQIPKDGKQANPDDRMLVMKFSDTEYSIQYPGGKNAIYWRGYPIKIGGTSCVQLQLLGTDRGPVPPEENQLFQVVTYKLNDDQLEVKTLNPKLVEKELKGSEAIKKAFLEHKDNKTLFTDPSQFKKIKPEQ